MWLPLTLLPFRSPRSLFRNCGRSPDMHVPPAPAAGRKRAREPDRSRIFGHSPAETAVWRDPRSLNKNWWGSRLQAVPWWDQNRWGTTARPDATCQGLFNTFESGQRNAPSTRIEGAVVRQLYLALLYIVMGYVVFVFSANLLSVVAPASSACSCKSRAVSSSTLIFLIFSRLYPLGGCSMSCFRSILSVYSASR